VTIVLPQIYWLQMVAMKLSSVLIDRSWYSRYTLPKKDESWFLDEWWRVLLFVRV